METRVITAADKRAEVQRRAAALGIDEAYISILVDRFYERVRADEALGPVFDKAIGDNWGPHLTRMKDFWASVALNAGRYSGKPVPAHLKLSDVQRAHFTIWLSLFRETLDETAPTPGAVAYFMEPAERIAQSLQLAMFGLPELEPR